MHNQSGTSNGRGGANPQSRRRAPSFPLPLSLSPFALRPSRRRRAVTLIELLITMTIMAIISAAILGTAAAAIESSREKKTQSLITKIHTLLMERYASYETRRVEVAPAIVNAINAWAAAAPSARSNARSQMLADARLLGIRELMKKEMPDRWEDVTYVPNVLYQAPPLAQTYFRRYQQLPTQPALSSAESAECLYLVIMNATGDGEARTLFSKQDIGDTDEDGAPEFIDGWGNPIGWMRWPAGVVSDLQTRNPDGTRPGESDHDPFDQFRRDSPTATSLDISFYPDINAGPSSTATFRTVYRANMRDRMQRATGANMTHQLAYRLTPLVYSAGPDGSSAMLIIEDPSMAPLDPYLAASSQGYADGTQTGASDPNNRDANKDNITNHDVQY
ncbi:MAG: prepilin-type N-terminal cleavage/methylation domain-containing protein [Planctomycetaceae bacterium]|nr:prepilin-type N-terminal cleavage/methylation domain-containing protein [Planctomycetaceae bacterium]